MLRLAEMTWTEVRDLDRSRTVAILPTGAVEAHGPHLPLGTDGVIAAAMAEAGAERLAMAGLVPVLLPPLDYTAAPFASSFPGTLAVSPETVTALVVDLARGLAGFGVAALAIANAHFDPAHLGALYAAVERIRGELEILVVFPDVVRKPWVHRLGEELASGACHAGRYEGSIVLARRPDAVRDDVRRGLEPVPISLSRAIRDGLSTFVEAGGDQAYFGDPAAATAEEGRQNVATLGAILAEAVLAAWPAEKSSTRGDATSPG